MCEASLTMTLKKRETFGFDVVAGTRQTAAQAGGKLAPKDTNVAMAYAVFFLEAKVYTTMVSATMAQLYPMDSDFMDVMIPENLPIEALVDDDTMRILTPVEEELEKGTTQEVPPLEAGEHGAGVDDTPLTQAGQPDNGEERADNATFLARWGIVIGVSVSISLLAVLVGVKMARTRKPNHQH